MESREAEEIRRRQSGINRNEKAEKMKTHLSEKKMDSHLNIPLEYILSVLLLHILYAQVQEHMLLTLRGGSFDQNLIKKFIPAIEK